VRPGVVVVTGCRRGGVDVAFVDVAVVGSTWACRRGRVGPGVVDVAVSTWRLSTWGVDVEAAVVVPHLAVLVVSTEKGRGVVLTCLMGDVDAVVVVRRLVVVVGKEQPDDGVEPCLFGHGRAALSDGHTRQITREVRALR